MCRHVAWLGRPRSLHDLVLEPEHGLLVQSYAPRRQRNGRLNADGWGVGFYAPSRPEAARWRSSRPLWSDASFASVAPVISSTCVVAAVRSATAGMPADETAAAPFQSGEWLLSHNGIVDREVLGPHPAAESVCDSAQLAAHLFEFGPDRVAEFVVDVGKRDPGARLNLLLTNGHRVLATRWNDTLSVLRADDGIVVASEPYDDDPRWADVPDHHLVDVTADSVTITDLEA
ncbi:MAG TPA: ergothioneine biosynthesis protein EgtC [Streptosporangiaceae bacterium]